MTGRGAGGSGGFASSRLGPSADPGGGSRAPQTRPKHCCEPADATRGDRPGTYLRMGAWRQTAGRTRGVLVTGVSFDTSSGYAGD